VVLNNNYVLGIASGVFASLLVYLFVPEPLPHPYSDVKVLAATKSEDNVTIEATFVKNECSFVRLEVFGDATGVPIRLEWSGVDGTPDNYDRAAGSQYLAIEVQGAVAFDNLEVRTRHDCNGVVVDKVFANVDL
jgi:hypothetical protein